LIRLVSQVGTMMNILKQIFFATDYSEPSRLTVFGVEDGLLGLIQSAEVCNAHSRVCSRIAGAAASQLA